VRVRPTCAYDDLLVWLPLTGYAPAFAGRAGHHPHRHALRGGRGAPCRPPLAAVLRHTFCTHTANARVAIDVIRELAGHADIRTTTIYIAVYDERLENALAQRTRSSPADAAPRRRWCLAGIHDASSQRVLCGPWLTQQRRCAPSPSMATRWSTR
jgi:hypothetical protein